MFENIELYLLNDLDETFTQYSEMTNFQRSFICGLLKENRPSKIVEIGVSAGGTTSVVLKCLDELNNKCCMYSIDVSCDYYRNPKLRTGFLVDGVKECCRGVVEHSLFLGKPIPYYLDEIGEGIDFLILDSAHVLPGELLDFLVCIPYMKDGGVIVLHDIIAHIQEGKNSYIATKLIFDTFCGKKYFVLDEDNPNESGLSNIAALTIDDTTMPNIRNVFMALAYVWDYELSMEDEEKYRAEIRKKYPHEYAEWTDRIFRLQHFLFAKKCIQSNYRSNWDVLLAHWKGLNNVYIYGAGYWAKQYTLFADYYGLNIKGYVVSDGSKTEDKFCNKQILSLSELEEKTKDCFFVLAMDSKYHGSISILLAERGFHNII